MTNGNDPIAATEAKNGLTKREEFALTFAKQLIAEYEINFKHAANREMVMNEAVDMADDFIKALNR